MPVTTRFQYRRFQTLENTLQFQNTIENPCVLQVILKNLSTKDMVRMKQISKDVRYNEVIDKQLKEAFEYKQKVNKIVKKVKNYMYHINTMYYSTEKIRIICKMINLLCINIWFVKDHPAFERVVHNQLFRFMEECPVMQDKCTIFLKRLFNLELPKNYYNSQTGLSVYGMLDRHGKFVELKKHL